MSTPSLRIAVLHYQPKDEPADVVTEQVAAALRDAGHTPVLLRVDESITDLVRRWRAVARTSSSTCARPSPTTTGWR
ncbi:hypothetical protein ACN28S_00540 [Cystobacter fuscus]